MTLPFTQQQFFALFRSYNEAVWPAPLVLTAVALAAIALSRARSPGARRAVFGSLAVLWLWTGLVYQLAFFSAINPAARLFAVLWLAGAALFAARAWRPGAAATAPGAVARVVGGLFILYALVLYPLLGMAAGHHYPAAPTFGTPCPVTIFTLGILLWQPARPILFAPPLIWSVIGGSAAFLLGVPQDMGLLLAGLATIALLVAGRISDRRRARAA